MKTKRVAEIDEEQENVLNGSHVLRSHSGLTKPRLPSTFSLSAVFAV